MSLWTSEKFKWSSIAMLWIICVFYLGEYWGLHSFTDIAKEQGRPDWTHLAENFTDGGHDVENSTVEVSPYTFRLKPGIENIEADAAIVHYHMNQTAKGIREMSKKNMSIALANYFAAIVNMTDKEVKTAVANSINDFLHTFNCPKWDLAFEETVEYILCDCSHTTVKDWMRAVEEKETTHDCTISSNHSDNLLLKAAMVQVHKCNAQFAWSLLTMLFVEHGPNAGVQYFRSGDFKLYYEVLDLPKMPNATKLSLAKDFIRIVEKHLHEGVAEGHYLRMDIIVTALNNMHKYDKESWLSRFQFSMADAFESRQPKEEPKKETRVRSKEELINDEAPLIIGILVIGLILLFVVKFFWQRKIKAWWKLWCPITEVDPEDGAYELATIQPSPNQDSSQDPEAPAGSPPDPMRASATVSESEEPAETPDQHPGPSAPVSQGPLVSRGSGLPIGAIAKSLIKSIRPSVSSGSRNDQDLEPVSRPRMMSCPEV